jgi:hypothetical protein
VETTAGPHPVTTARHGVCSCKNHKVITVFQKNEIQFFSFFLKKYVFNVTETKSQCPQITNLKKKECAKKIVMAESKNTSCRWNILKADGS